MANGNNRLVRKPDSRSGPAVLDREPVVLPEQRKRVADRLKDALGQ